MLGGPPGWAGRCRDRSVSLVEAMGTVGVATFLLIAIALVIVVGLRPDLSNSVGGRLMVFAALFLLPLVSIRTGVETHMEASKDTRFCMACHVMEPYGRSLLLADDSYLPAGHFQNRRVDRDRACFNCHTQYTMFGDLKAKMAGLQHMIVQVTGRIPETIELYQPYHNRECLHCHTGAREFEEVHVDDMADLVSNEVPCMECHGPAHDIEGNAEAELWTDDLEATLKGGPIE